MGRATRRPRDPSSNAKDSSADASPGTGINQQQPGDSSNPLNLITRGCTPSLDDSVPHPKQYIETNTILGCIGSPDYKLREIVDKPDGVDYNEWLASHAISFFDHINMLYGCISEFCTMSGCPEMAGPGNRQYLWIDEKGKRTKLPAPQYIDYALTFTQKTVNDESIFPTKFDKEFPVTFESHVKKILRLMFNVLAHVYHGHFKEIVLLNLHSHLNCLFSHLILFNDTFKLVTEEKELESLVEDVYALNMSHFDPNKLNNQQQPTTTATTVTQQLTTVTTTQQVTTGKSSPSQSSSSLATNTTKGVPSNPSPTMDGSHVVPAKSLKHSPSHSQAVNPVTSPVSTTCPSSNVTAMETSSGMTPSPSPSMIQQQPCPSSTITPPSTPGQSAGSSLNSRMEID